MRTDREIIYRYERYDIREVLGVRKRMVWITLHLHVILYLYIQLSPYISFGLPIPFSAVVCPVVLVWYSF